MTAEEQIKEVMELVSLHGTHRELEGRYSDGPGIGKIATALMNQEKAVKLRAEIEAKLRNLIKDEA